MSIFAVRNLRSARSIAAITAIAACAAGLVGVFQPVQGGDILEPILEIAPPSYTAGDNIPVYVEATGGPTNVYLYSNPPGAVSYSGSINSASGTLTVPTNPNITGDVTIYFSTGGQQVVSSTSNVEGNDTPENPN
jgi:hypothetical protein